jgi:hypothetical protein
VKTLALRDHAIPTLSLLKRSALATVLIVTSVFLLILLLRGMNFGPLQTDIIIIRAWFDEVGVGGFAKRYFDVNQRHLLVGPIVSAMYTVFGKQDAPYNFILLASRMLQGVFLAGVVFQLTRRWLFAVCAGLILAFSVIRVAELYQEINWFIEPTLCLLLASSYTYLLSFRASSHWAVWLWRGLSVILYAISVLTYEAGLPWIAVNVYLGWFAREEVPPRKRLWLSLRDALPAILIGGVVGSLVLFVFAPWKTLAPGSSGLLSRFLQRIASGLNLLSLYWNALSTLLHNGYGLLLLVSVVVSGALLALMARGERNESTARKDYRVALGMGLVMFIASLLVGVSSGGIVHAYVDRITFGRIAGVSLIYAALIFLVFDYLRIESKQAVAAAIIGVLLVAPGAAWLWAYQDYAQAATAETEHLTDVILQNRASLGPSPLYLVIVTSPDWSPAHFVDVSDVIVHGVQQNLWRRGGDAIVDILHTGANADEYATHPGTCDTLSGEASAGLCLLPDAVHTSRWASGPTHALNEVVIVRYDHVRATLTPLKSIRLDDLIGYNIASAGPTILETSPTRLVIP